MVAALGGRARALAARRLGFGRRHRPLRVTGGIDAGDRLVGTPVDAVRAEVLQDAGSPKAAARRRLQPCQVDGPAATLLATDDLVDRLHAELVKALATPEVSERIRAQAYDTWTLTPDEFAAFLRTDHAKWGKVVKLAGARAE